MSLKTILNNADYSDKKNSNKELVNGSFDEGYKGWIIPSPETVKILSENGINFLRIQSGSVSGYIIQIIEGLEPNTKYKLTGKARVSTPKDQEDYFPAIFGLQNDTFNHNTFVVDSTDFITGSVTLSTDTEGYLRIFLAKTEMGIDTPPAEVTADFTGFIFEKA
ncbi:carbohydrate binding domain-containing protein [Photorhabdus caribbeanensis]|uniref:carbohydrate binding domain-containing protein n=1 Tax=Photorhabdus caribbeanensis TaxID=1004165 RepID=UPI001BD31362|nr:carbohydrate binding domain-containing protein [Photorhabdus caribbeanensis]MBS9425833.1 hypothetical protein [Photorhabdus caribbeanensis]